MERILLFAAAALTIIWGIAHLFPTASVVRGFGDISQDNRHIITMEWIIEGITLFFIGALTGMVTLINPGHPVSEMVYLSVVGFLFVLTIISLFTGFKVNFLPYKLCPVIFSISAILVLLGGVLN